MRTFNGPIPSRIERLPVDPRGFPIPFFVAYQDGKPLFPVMDPAKMRACMRRNLCWVCGEPLGTYKCFPIGPMCAINHIASEPPSHLDCATFAARNCPFMTQPLAKRAELGGKFDKPGGVMIARNPGTTALWVTKSFTVIWDGPHGPGQHRKPLWRIGEPTGLTFWARGRLATRAEVNESIRTGLPLLQRQAALDGGSAVPELQRQVDAATGLLDGLLWAEEPA